MPQTFCLLHKNGIVPTIVDEVRLKQNKITTKTFHCDTGKWEFCQLKGKTIFHVYQSEV